MKWSNTWLIFQREVRDQLRDRRTLFMIFVLPVLLYPLMGLSMFQIAQFMREHATRVLVIHPPEVADVPPLLESEHFAADLFGDPDRAKLLQLVVEDDSEGKTDQETLAAASRRVLDGEFEAALVFPAEFAERLAQFRAGLLDDKAQPDHDSRSIPSPQVISNTAQEKSQITAMRVNEVLRRWNDEIGQQNLRDSHLPAQAARPFELTGVDVAAAETRKAAIWAKLLPIVLLIWALTGAFYPAVDLCAGEKERGTLETLLSSPADRSEIVGGKLLTVMLFSSVTALLNMISLGATGITALNKIADIGPPPLAALGWLVVALVPMSAMFSALCLALAVMAKSTKEGQYYLMPLILITLPLTLLPMSPGVTLSYGTSMIPVTGVVLLLRTALEGNSWQALPYVPVVAMVTAMCCWLAIRWAIDQFNKESVLFRESERFDLGLWLKRAYQYRGDTPSPTLAMFAGVLILTLQYFASMSLTAGMPKVLAILIPQAIILLPALVLALTLTRRPQATLLLRWPSWQAALAAVGLAVVMAPLSSLLREAVLRLFPMSDALIHQLQDAAQSFTGGEMLWPFVVFLPAICEEFAFRGFILSGLRNSGSKWRAILFSALLFGIAHNVLQQSINAVVLGVILAFIAVQTGSLLPGMLFHSANNGLALFLSTLAGKPHTGIWDLLLQDGEFGMKFRWTAVLVSVLGTVYLLQWFGRMRYERTAEESLQEEIAHMAEVDAELDELRQVEAETLLARPAHSPPR